MSISNVPTRHPRGLIRPLKWRLARSRVNPKLLKPVAHIRIWWPISRGIRSAAASFSIDNYALTASGPLPADNLAVSAAYFNSAWHSSRQNLKPLNSCTVKVADNCERNTKRRRGMSRGNPRHANYSRCFGRKMQINPRPTACAAEK